MRHLKLIGALAVLALLTGCATTTTELVEVTPECEAPVIPALPVVEWDDLLIPFRYIPVESDDYRTYDDALTDLEAYEARLVDSLVEHRAVIDGLCSE